MVTLSDHTSCHHYLIAGRLCIRWLLVLSLGSMLPFLGAQDIDNLRQEVLRIIDRDTDLRTSTTPGWIIGIIDGDSTFIMGFGSIHKDTSIAPHGNHIFELGGLTKVFTALLVQHLFDEGLLSPDDKVNNFLPASFRNPILNDISIRHLLLHTTPLSTIPTNLGLKESAASPRYSQYTFDDLLAYWAQVETPMAKNTPYVYSHTNYAIVEYIVEQVTGRTYTAYIREVLFDKLAMSHSALYCPFDSLLAPGYERSGSLAEAWNFTSFGASEGMTSSMNDLLHFLRQMMFKAHPLHTQFAAQLVPQKRLGKSRFYTGLGWHIFLPKRHPPYYLHSGKTSGHSAAIHFMPSTRTAVVLLTNSTHSTQGLGQTIMMMLNRRMKEKLRFYEE